jgi:transcriptional regulator with XRE-family HTH domain
MQAICSISTYGEYDLPMQTGRPSNRPRPAFGTRLHQLREQKGLSQAQLAQHLGISTRAYAFWEREPVSLKPDQLRRLAEVLGVTSDSLLGKQDAPARKGGPVGKTRLIFEEVSRLPHHQQRKIVEVVQALVAQNAAAAA